MWANFHTHSHYCDGKTGLPEVLKKAESSGLISLGFSSHAPLPFGRAWAMSEGDLDAYLQEISELRSMPSPVQIYAGLEVDFVPGKISPRDFRSKLDYTIGSVHFVDHYTNGDPWEIDNTHKVFEDGLEGIFKGNIKEAITRYYELTREMIDHHTPDVLGHMDKIKIQNIGEKLFSEDDQWYREQIDKTIARISESGVIVEVNTRGLYQKKSSTTYPSPWVIEKLFQNNVPVTISSDAHHPDDLTNYFIEAARTIATAGYRHIKILHDGKWQSYRFNENGIVL